MSQPAIRVSINITPSTFLLGEESSLTLIATLSHSGPITIYTWPTIFNLHLAQKRKNFFCVDTSNSNSPVHLELTKGGKRSGYISRELGGVHDAFFHTLEPDKPVSFTAPFILTTRNDSALKAGHKYLFGVNEGEKVGRWFNGRREDVMSPPGEAAGLREGSGLAIILDIDGPVDFEVQQE